MSTSEGPIIPEWYLQDLREFSTPPTPEERERLIAALADDPEAEEALANGFLRMVVSIAAQYRWSGLPLADVIQEGNIGLVRGIRKFDPERGPLPECIQVWVHQAILRALSTNSRTVRLPEAAYRQLREMRRFKETFWTTHRRAPTIEEIEKGTGIPQDRILAIIRADAEHLSLGDANDTDRDIEATDCAQPAQVLDAHEDEDVETIVQRQILFETVHETVNAIPNPITRSVVQEYFGIEHDARTFRQIGAQHGLSRTWASNTRNQCLRWVRDHLPDHCRQLYLEL